MGYCWPQWISPTSYNKAATFLKQAAAGGAAAPGAAGVRNAASQAYWEVSGNINRSVATLDP